MYVFKIIMNTYIYILIDPRDQHVRYVGKSNNPKERLKSHFFAYKPTRKYGWLYKLRSLQLKPIMVIVDEVPMDEWQFWETYWYEQMIAWGFELYNSDLPGKGGHYKTMEERRNMKKPTKGKTLIEAYGEEKGRAIGEKISRTKKNKTREEIKEISKKRNETFVKNNDVEEWKKKLSESHKGKKMPEEVKVKMSESVKNSVAHKEGIKNRRSYDGVENPNSRGVIYQYSKDGKQLIREWYGLPDLHKAKFNIGNISSCIKGKLKSCAGYYWTREKLSLDF